MGYNGDQINKKRQFNKDGTLIDPEDILVDRLLGMFNDEWIDINCYNCKHLNEDEISCKAFPNVIPSRILNGDISHVKKILDEDVVFELKDSLKDSKNQSKN